MSDVKCYEITWNAHEDAPVLKMLTVVCFTEQTGPTGDRSTQGLIGLFVDGFEGWPPMGGSEGIKILACDVPGVNYDDMARHGS